MQDVVRSVSGDAVATRICVVIPHLNQPDMLARCLASLQAGQRRPDEVIVVDNGSSVLPEQICAAAGARLLTEARPGPGPARNRGVSVATSDVLAFIDADCLADADWLQAAQAAMADPTAMILGGDVRIAYADPMHLTRLEAYESVYAYRMDRYIAREGFTGTGNLVVRRAVLADVGSFAGIGVAEDRDWGQRATAKGYRIRYVAGMKVYHPARQRFSELRQKWDRHMAHDFIQARQAMGLSPAAELPRVLLSDRISGVGTRAQAFVGLTQIRLYRAWQMARLLGGLDPQALAQGWNRPAAKP